MFPIYEKWFAEVVLQFTKSERVSLNHIYQKVRDLNWKLGEQQQFWDVYSDDKTQNETNLRKTVMLMEGVFITTGMIDHMIKDLRTHKERINVWDPKVEAAMFDRQQYLLDELRRMSERRSTSSGDEPPTSGELADRQQQTEHA